MEKVENKDSVAIAYIGKLDNGTVFQTVTNDKPLKIVIGNGDTPPTLESALMGMKVGEKKQVRVGPEESYGIRQKDLLQELKRENLGEKIDPKPGMILSLKVEKDGQDHKIPATIIEVKDDIVTIDYNHPLAGHHLTYDLEVVNIIKHTEG